MSDVTLFKKFQKSPIFFIEKMWGLKPLKEGETFIKGKHITKQQEEILKAVEKAVNKEGKNRISIASGHGIGKTATLSWLLLWYLFCFKESQVACTAPTSDQMYDVLWKEVAKWIQRMPEVIANLYDWGTTHIRIKESPATWFARAKTARKEAPEALAGVHGEYVMFLVDEASGVPEEIYNTAEGSLTDENTLVILISNPTRLIGYFYDTHNNDRESEKWETFSFSCLDSPLVQLDYVENIKNKHGEDSDEYRIRVLGKFPKEDAIDDKGYVPLFSRDEIMECEDVTLWGRDTRLGIDPAGEGRDETIFVFRDDEKAKIIAKEKTSNEYSIAQKALTLMNYYRLEEQNVTVDNFGVGANIAREMAKSGIIINAVNVGIPADDPDRYLNKRAELGFQLKDWLKEGRLVRNERWLQLLNIRYRRELSGKIKLMSKQEMRKEGIKSPDAYDALALTFYRQHLYTNSTLTDEELNELTNIY